MIADNPLLVIGTLRFMLFHTPVIVSSKITKPTQNNSPEIGIKNAAMVAVSLTQFACIVANSMDSCDFTRLKCCYCIHSQGSYHITLCRYPAIE